MTIRNVLMTGTADPVAYASAPPVLGPVGSYTPTAADVVAAKMNQANTATTGDVRLKRSRDSAAMLDYWDLTDAIVDGVKALRDAGDRYLPKFRDEDTADHQYRLRCTKLTNIYRDTVEGLASKPFEEEVSFPAGEGITETPADVLEFAENVDGSGSNLTEFASLTFFNGINSAIDWIFVDYSKPDPKVRSIRDARVAGVRPYWSHVLARNVLDVQSKMVGGSEVLTFMKIFEPGSPDRIREFERTDTGSIDWRLYEKRDGAQVDNSQFIQIDGGVLAIDQIPLVPFITGRRDGKSWQFFPAMRDAADLQIELYQQESALKFAKQLAAYPMLAGNGVKPPVGADGRTPTKLSVGPGRVLYAPPDANGTAGSWTYVEPSAQSLKFLAEDIKETQAQLRELARQPLTANAGTITVINSAMAAGKAKSAVKAWALMLKNALENALVITGKWTKSTYDPQVNVYMEFDEFLEGKDLESLDADRDRGDISRETLLEEKKRRGVYSPEFTFEREEARLLAEAPGEGDEEPSEVP